MLLKVPLHVFLEAHSKKRARYTGHERSDSCDMSGFADTSQRHNTTGYILRRYNIYVPLKVGAHSLLLLYVS